MQYHDITLLSSLYYAVLINVATLAPFKVFSSCVLQRQIFQGALTRAQVFAIAQVNFEGAFTHAQDWLQDSNLN